MNKSELVREVAARTKIPPSDVARVTESLIEVVTQSVVRGEKVMLSGFGTFYRKPRARRVARDIHAERAIAVPATNVPAFNAGKPFKEAVARKRRTAAKRRATR